MSRNYSQKTFLRQTPNHTLKEYFRRKNLLQDVDFDRLGKTEIEPVVEEMDRLPEEERVGIEADFQLINEMAYEKGVEILIEEAGFYHNLDLLPVFELMENPYEKALWVFMNHRRIFEVASDFDYMERVGGWRRRYVGENLIPAAEEDDKERLAQAVSTFYKKQGRGRHCKVDNYQRGEPERHCYFVYPEDHATTELEIDESGEFKNRRRKPVFEIIFVYKPENGELEVRANGGQKVIEKLQRIFSETILGLDSLPNRNDKPFDLSNLKDKQFNFVTKIEDGIEKVTIKMLRLDLPGYGSRRITFEVSSSGKGQPIHTLIERVLNKQNVSLEKLVVTKATIHIKFMPKDSKRGKTLRFDISIPNHWTLKDDPYDQIAKKYIEKWGLVSG